MIKAYIALIKLRLTTTVVATAIFGYLLALKFNSESVHWFEEFNWVKFILLISGGLLIVFCSNGFNQIIEMETDAKMSRTENRPLIVGSISVNHARIFCALCGLIGLSLLAVINFTVFFLGLLSIISYVLVYTPLKGVTPLAVMIGAIPGALPPLIGYSAYMPNIDVPGCVLFLVQFFWQFPHFWAIAWILHEDYQKAKYWLLPSGGGTDKNSAQYIIIYTILLILCSLMPAYIFYVNEIAGVYNLTQFILCLLVGIYLLYRSIKLYTSLQVADAKKLMYASLIFTPVVYLVWILV